MMLYYEIRAALSILKHHKMHVELLHFEHNDRKFYDPVIVVDHDWSMSYATDADTGEKKWLVQVGEDTEIAFVRGPLGAVEELLTHHFTHNLSSEISTHGQYLDYLESKKFAAMM